MHGISALVLLYICVSVVAFKVNDADYSIEEAAEEEVKPSKLKKGLVKDQDVGVGISGDKKGRDGKAVVKSKIKGGSSKGLVKAKVGDSLESDKPKDSRRTVGSKGQKGKYNVDNDKYHEVQTHNPDLNNKNKTRNDSKQNPRGRYDRKSNDKKDEIRTVTEDDVRPVTTFEDGPGTDFVDPFDETHTSPEPDITMPEKSGHYSSSSRPSPSTVNINSNEDSDDDDDDDDDDEIITSTTDSSDSDSDETVEYEATSSHKNREKENDFIVARIESTSTSEEPITDATVEYTDGDGDIDIDLRTSSSTSSFDDDEKLHEPERESESSEDCNSLFKALNLCDFYKASKNLFYRVVVDLRHRPQ